MYTVNIYIHLKAHAQPLFVSLVKGQQAIVLQFLITFKVQYLRPSAADTGSSVEFVIDLGCFLLGGSILAGLSQMASHISSD